MKYINNFNIEEFRRLAIDRCVAISNGKDKKNNRLVKRIDKIILGFMNSDISISILDQLILDANSLVRQITAIIMLKCYYKTEIAVFELRKNSVNENIGICNVEAKIYLSDWEKNGKI